MTDLISREMAIGVVGRRCGMCIQGILDIPSAQTEIEERKEESTQNVPKEDLISRKAAIDAFSNNGSFFVYGADVCKAIVSRIKQLPSAEPDTDEWCTDCKEYDTEFAGRHPGRTHRLDKGDRGLKWE